MRYSYGITSALLIGGAAISLGLGFAFLGDGLGQMQRRQVAA